MRTSPLRRSLLEILRAVIMMFSSLIHLLGQDLRSKKIFLASWLIPLILLTYISPIATENSIPNPDDLASIGAASASSAGVIAFYGPLPTILDIYSLTAWKTGMTVMVLGAIMAVLLATYTSIGHEENGRAEILLSQGMTRGTLLGSSILSLVIITGIFAFGSGLSLVPTGASLIGSLSYGLALFFSTSIFGLMAILIGQVTGSERLTKALSLTLIGFSFMVRVFADLYTINWLRALSPLGWRDLLKPFDGEEFFPALYMALSCVAVIGATFFIKRDLGSQVRVISHALKSRSGYGLSRLWISHNRVALSFFSGGIIIFSIAFFALVGEMSKIFSTTPEAAMIFEQLGFGSSVIAGAAQSLALLHAVVLSIMAIVLSQSLYRAEISGTLSLLLSTGRTRWEILLRTWLLVALMTAGIAMISGLLAALAAIMSPEVQADQFYPLFFKVIDLYPATFFAFGFSFLLMGLAPRFVGLAYLPVALSALLSFFAEFFPHSKTIIKFSLYSWAPHMVDHALGVGVLILGGLVCSIIGIRCYIRRDLLA
ncbi:hypothetical protein [Corynebacterium sp. ES2775-CONJ]|uniref:hypothetical protein n=1 Tax=Corynebacterium sp. ES2775-CONJ TaxID=2974029 RepID=UPI0021684D84|nr:hypothetical protein [Corynebacterium sp. ES2775-CONJ]